jgi:hypothetical protein
VLQLVLKLKVTTNTDAIVDKTSVVDGFSYDKFAYNVTICHFLGLLKSKVWADFVEEVRNQLAGIGDIAASLAVDFDDDWNPEEVEPAEQEEEEEEEEGHREAAEHQSQEHQRRQRQQQQQQQQQEEEAQEAKRLSVLHRMQQSLLQKQQQQNVHQQQSQSEIRKLQQAALDSPSWSGEWAGNRPVKLSQVLKRKIAPATQLPSPSPVKKNAKFVFKTPSAPTTLNLSASDKKSPPAAAAAAGRSQPSAAAAAAASGRRVPASKRSSSLQTDESSAASDSE